MSLFMIFLIAMEGGLLSLFSDDNVIADLIDYVLLSVLLAGVLRASGGAEATTFCPAHFKQRWVFRR